MDTILFTLQHTDARQPTKAHGDDAGWDLYVSRPAVVQPMQLVEIHSDLCVALPHGYWAHLVGRSSTPRRYGLHVVEAVIDGGYRGELFFAVRNFGEKMIVVHAGTRLAQLIPHRVADVHWSQAAALPQSSRGADGFGSSGR